VRTEAQGSVSHWMGASKTGDAEAAQRLWEGYLERLVRLNGRPKRAERHSAALAGCAAVRGLIG
jgi:hypothetical protein